MDVFGLTLVPWSFSYPETVLPHWFVVYGLLWGVEANSGIIKAHKELCFTIKAQLQELNACLEAMKPFYSKYIQGSILVYWKYILVSWRLPLMI